MFTINSSLDWRYHHNYYHRCNLTFSCLLLTSIWSSFSFLDDSSPTVVCSVAVVGNIIFDQWIKVWKYKFCIFLLKNSSLGWTHRLTKLYEENYDNYLASNTISFLLLWYYFLFNAPNAGITFPGTAWNKIKYLNIQSTYPYFYFDVLRYYLIFKIVRICWI